MGAPKKLTAVEVAAQLGVSRRQVLYLIAAKELTGTRTGEGRGARYDIDEDSVTAYLERHTVPAPQPTPGRPALAEVLGPLYTLTEVAAYLNRSPEALEHDARKGKFAHIHIGRDRRMTVPQVRQLIEQFTVLPGQRTLTIPTPDDDPLAKTRERVIRLHARRAARGVARQ